MSSNVQFGLTTLGTLRWVARCLKLESGDIRPDVLSLIDGGLSDNATVEIGTDFIKVVDE